MRVACKREGLDVGVWGRCMACIQGRPGVRAWCEGWASGACGLASEHGTSVSEFRSRDLSFFVFCYVWPSLHSFSIHFHFP